MELHTFPIERALKASLQQRELYEGKGLAGDAYRASCHALWALLDKEARPNTLKGTPFEYLARKFNNLREEAKKKPGKLDPAFRDWHTFAYHVGPRPSDKHQLDRINDSDNYRVGNVRWLHATRQNSNKRANRPHQYQGRRYTDAELRHALADALLPELAERLDEPGAWNAVLSGGEQQRLALARVLLKRPAWVFADEATSALDGPAERRLYQRLRQLVAQRGGALVSVAHRDSVRAFHHTQWTLDEAARQLRVEPVEKQKRELPALA